MTSKKICVIPGDGIGPEVTSAAMRVLAELAPDVRVVEAAAGWNTFQETGNSVPEETLHAIRDCGAALFGAVSSPSKKVEGYRSAILQIRQQLQLNANLRPIQSCWNFVEQVSPPVDLMIVRENSEGLYSGRETDRGHEVVAEKVVTEQASFRLGAQAANLARRRSGRILIAHKANVLPLTEGLFRDSVRKAIEAESKATSVEEGLVDIVAHRLVASPSQFDLIVTTNMFGDILSDLAAHWCGGMGRAPSLNLGESFAVAEPVHGSAPDIAGQGVADPTATVLSLALLCRHFWNDESLAERLEAAALFASQQMKGLPFSTEAFTAHACSMTGSHEAVVNLE